MTLDPADNSSLSCISSFPKELSGVLSRERYKVCGIESALHVLTGGDKTRENLPSFGSGQAPGSVLVSFLRPGPKSFWVLSTWPGLSLDQKSSLQVQKQWGMRDSWGQKKKPPIDRGGPSSPHRWIPFCRMSPFFPHVPLLKSWAQACHL